MRIILNAEEIRKAIREQILGQTLIGSGSTFDIVFTDDNLDYQIDSLQAAVDIEVVSERPRHEIVRRSPFTKIGESTIVPLAQSTEAPVVISRRGRPPGAKNKPKETAQEATEQSVEQSATDAAEAPEANAVARVSPFARLSPLKPVDTEIEAVLDTVEEAVVEAAEGHVEEPELPLGTSEISEEIPAIFATDPNAVEPEPIIESAEVVEEEVPVVVSKRSLFGEAAAKAEETVEEPAVTTDGEEEAPKSASRSIFANLKSIQHSRS